MDVNVARSTLCFGLRYHSPGFAAEKGAYRTRLRGRESIHKCQTKVGCFAQFYTCVHVVAAEAAAVVATAARAAVAAVNQLLVLNSAGYETN